MLLDSENPAIYKQLYRAAKAKLKLRIKVTTSPVNTTTEAPAAPSPEPASEKESSQRYSYLDTVLSSPLSNAMLRNTQATLKDTQAANPVQVISPARSLVSSIHVPITTQKLGFPLRFSEDGTANNSFCIDCNHCGKVISSNHYHCGICDDGDYDLCLSCVDAGVTCPGEGHWLLKRLVQNGVVNNSTTETIASKRTQESLTQNPEPRMVKEEADVSSPATQTRQFNNLRTCDACFHGMLKMFFIV